MSELPIYLSILFIICTVYTLFLLYVASGKSNKVLLISLAWIGIQGALAYSEFYVDEMSIPPRFPLAFAPTLIFIGYLFFSKSGRKFIDSLDLQTLYLIHVVRIPVEFGLFGLAIYNTIPMLMTFEGANFDIAAGITVPLIILGYFYKDWFSNSFVLIWNLICLGLLVGIIVNSILSVESPIQMQAFDQPNIAMMYFPYILLPCYIVPVVIFSHLVCIRRAYSK